MNKIFNTKKQGVVRTIIFKKGGIFEAVCLDFDLIEEAKTMAEAENKIREAIVGYVQNICKNKLSDELLNRHAEKKYWDMYNQYQDIITKGRDKKNTPSFQMATNNTAIFTLPIKTMALCHD